MQGAFRRRVPVSLGLLGAVQKFGAAPFDFQRLFGKPRQFFSKRLAALFKLALAFAGACLARLPGGKFIGDGGKAFSSVLGVATQGLEGALRLY